MSAMRSWLQTVTRRPNAVRCGPIGMELAGQKMHLVQLEGSSDRNVALRAHASVPFPGRRDDLLKSPEAFRKVLQRGLQGDKFKGRRAVLAMPAGFFRTMSLGYQVKAGLSDEQVIAQLMQERLDGDIHDYVIDWLPVRTRVGSDERLALVASSPRQNVIDYLEIARMAGLRVGALEIGPAAIRRLISVMPSDDEADVTLVINTGQQSSYLTMIAGRRLLFDKKVAFGERPLLQCLGQTLELNEEHARGLVLRTGLEGARRGVLADEDAWEALVEILRPQFRKLAAEIERAFLYVASQMRGGAVTRIYLLGSLARWPGADAMLGDLAEVTISNFPNPLSFFAGSEGEQLPEGVTDSLAPEIAVATGLALREFAPGV